MAIINGLYVFVEDEDISRDVDSTTHPVEKGMEITSTVRKKPLEISLKGKIVDVEGQTASYILEQLISLQQKGSLVNYSGRNIANNLQIQSFSTSHPNTNAGGADFNMTLREIRISKSAYNPNDISNTSRSKDDLAVGDLVVFMGGYVYVSSDAKKPAANRGRSVCKITIINKRSWSTHDYHLISEDGGMVYGWCDLKNIMLYSTYLKQKDTDAGTQQVTEATENVDGNTEYYITKKGDTLYKIANVTYKDRGLKVKQIMKDNPNAFSEPGDASTLRVGVTMKITTGRM